MHVPQAILAAQKAPRRIDAVAPPAAVAGARAAGVGAAGAGVGGAPSAAASSLSQHGSAWNAAGTYEERDCSRWALADLGARLSALRGGACAVREVCELDGTAHVTSARGRTRRPFDFRFELRWEMRWEERWEEREVREVEASCEAQGGAGLGSSAATGAKCSGVLAYSDVSPAASGAAAPVAYELSERFEAAPPADVGERVSSDLRELKREMDRALQAFTADFGQK